MRRAVSEDKDRSLIERKEKTRIHKELETLEKNYQELQHQRKADVSIANAEKMAALKQVSDLEEARTKHLLQIDSLEQTVREQRKKLNAKSDGYESLEKEHGKLVEKLRDI